MSVYFVLRSFYEGPTAKRVTKFSEDSVLSWFQKHWQLGKGGNAHQTLEALLGADVYGFDTLFEAIADDDLPVPETENELWDTIESNLYVEGALQCEPHLIQVLTDDDELELAYYLLDDHFLAGNPGRADYVLHEGWELPSEASNPEADDVSYTEEMLLIEVGPDEDLDPGTDDWPEGACYFVFLTFYDSECLVDLDGGFVMQGRRLPDLARHMIRRKDLAEAELNWPRELAGVRNALIDYLQTREGAEKGFAAALLENADDDAIWSAYSDWLQEQGRRPAGVELLERAIHHLNDKETSSFLTSDRTREPRKSQLRVTDHLSQAILHIDGGEGQDFYHQWIFFDDLWYHAHESLANGLLRYARRWDALELGEPDDDEHEADLDADLEDLEHDEDFDDEDFDDEDFDDEDFDDEEDEPT